MKLGFRAASFYVLACGICFNGYTVPKVYAGGTDRNLPARDVYGAKAKPTHVSSGAGATISSGGGATLPSSGGVKEDRPAAVAAPAPTYRDYIASGCSALRALSPRNCGTWGTPPHEYPQEPYSSCRKEAMSNLKEARAALELAQLYENRGRKSDEEIKNLLIQRLQKNTSRGGVEVSTSDEAVRLAERMTREYKNANDAYGRCRDQSMSSAWKHNMILAGVMSKQEAFGKPNMAAGRGTAVNTCTPYINAAVDQHPDYKDSLTGHFKNNQSGMQNYLNQREAKSRARNWNMAVAFDAIKSNLPDGYRGDGWDNLGYKLFSLDINAQCSTGYTQTHENATAGQKAAGFFRNNWGKLLVGGLVVLGVLCATHNLPFSFCKKDKKYWPPKKPTTTTDTTVTTNDTTVTTNDTSVTTNDTSVTTNDTTVTTNDTSVTTNDTSVTTNDTSVTTNDTSVTTNDTSVTTNDTSVTTNDTSVTTNDTSVTTNDTSVTTNDTSVTTNDTSVTTNDTTVSLPPQDDWGPGSNVDHNDRSLSSGANRRKQNLAPRSSGARPAKR
ncbi:MAG TPA: hypothetical protein VM901_09165 [Bdellovibrionota bacterium]|nr:hypothetical protein [Bdellovibrionota bacterium]